MRLDHVGIAVKDWPQAVDKWREFTGTEPKFEDVSGQGFRVAVFDLGNARIELLGETADNSPISGFIKKRGGGIHHIALEVENIENKMKEAEEMGLELIDKTPQTGLENKKIAFFHPRSFDYTLVELCGPKED